MLLKFRISLKNMMEKIKISTYDFDSTTTKEQKFTVLEKEVQVYFGITRTTSLSIEKPPLTLSSMVFYFEEIQDYSFILELNVLQKSLSTFFVIVEILVLSRFNCQVVKVMLDNTLKLEK